MKRDFVVINDFSNLEIERLLELAPGMWGERGIYPRIIYSARAEYKEMVGLFLESSTRTRFSFEIAMHRLGGGASIVPDIQSTSLAKGETLADTARVVSGMADLIVIRHPWEGAAQVMADYSSVPVINAGDGAHQHPTQTLTDLYTIKNNKGRIEALKVGLCGDLKYGRTVHSLAFALDRLGAEIICIAPTGLEMPTWVLNQVESLVRTAQLEQVIGELDVLYFTRVQKERLPGKESYEAAKGSHILGPELMSQAKDDSLVLHPLPRVDEVDYEIDDDPRTKYFEQSHNGVPVRMALIAALLDKVDKGKVLDAWKPATGKIIIAKERCGNPRCVTQHEQYLKSKFKVILRSTHKILSCYYCEQEIR